MSVPEWRCADDQHRPVAQLPGPAVLARVQLQDLRVELGGEVGELGVRPNVPVATTTLSQRMVPVRGHDEPAAVAASSRSTRVLEPDRQREVAAYASR